MREKKRIQAFFQQSMEFRLSEFVGPRTKVHRLDKSYAYVPKNEGFHRRSKGGDLGEIKVFGFRGKSKFLY